MALYSGIWHGADCEACVNVTIFCSPRSKPSEIIYLVLSTRHTGLVGPNTMGGDKVVASSGINLPPDGSTTLVCLGRGQYFVVGVDQISDGWNGAT